MKQCQYEKCTEQCYGNSPNAKYCYAHKIIRDRETHKKYVLAKPKKPKASTGKRIYNRPQDDTYMPHEVNMDWLDDVNAFLASQDGVYYRKPNDMPKQQHVSKILRVRI